MLLCLWQITSDGLRSLKHDEIRFSLLKYVFTLQKKVYIQPEIQTPNHACPMSHRIYLPRPT